MSDLFQLVRDHIEATDQITQEWQTAEGPRTLTRSFSRPVAWIEKVHERGVLTALDCLSIIFFALDDWHALPTREQEIQLAEGWAAELRQAAHAGEIQARDPFTLLPLTNTPEGWDWGLSTSDADRFLAARGMSWRCGEIASHIYNEVASEIEAKRFPPFLGKSAHSTAVPVVAESASNAPLDAPQPVTTGDVAHAFDGLRRWNEKAWKDTLGSPPKWLEACIALRGERGKRETRWNPVLIGAALVHNGHAKANSIRARFQTKPQLQDWLEAWKTYEADNFDTP